VSRRRVVVPGLGMFDPWGNSVDRQYGSCLAAKRASVRSEHYGCSVPLALGFGGSSAT